MERAEKRRLNRRDVFSLVAVTGCERDLYGLARSTETAAPARVLLGRCELRIALYSQSAQFGDARRALVCGQRYAGTPSAWLFGEGFGRFPERHFAMLPTRSFPAANRSSRFSR
jgi:hypothetical protein